MIRKYLEKAARIESREFLPVLLSFTFVLSLMAAYSLLKPVRDSMSSNWSDAELSTLWTATFFISLFAVWLYGAACSRLRSTIIVPSVYLMFAASFVVFYSLLESPQAGEIAGKAFYVWISVFSLFHISVFWTYMADTYSREQSLRLFAMIGSGSSIGAIAGPALALLLVDVVGPRALLLVCAALLVLPIGVVLKMNQLRATGRLAATEADHVARAAPMGGSSLDGFKLFFNSRYLLGIGLFILLYVAINTFVYFQLKNLLADLDSAARVQVWAGIDLAVNVLAILTAWFGTSHLTAKLGMPKTIALVPAVITMALVALALTPMLWVVIALQIVRRAGNYSITRPCREMLFTRLDRESRFKAKNVIDVAVYRGGDVMFAWIFTGLTQGLGLGLGAVAAVGAVFAGLWTLLALRLGRDFESTETPKGSPDDLTVAPASAGG